MWPALPQLSCSIFCHLFHLLFKLNTKIRVLQSKESINPIIRSHCSEVEKDKVGRKLIESSSHIFRKVGMGFGTPTILKKKRHCSRLV